MKNSFLFIILSIFFLHVSARQAPERPYSRVMVKKRIENRICDTCKVDFALDAEPSFSYLIIGSGHTPARLYSQRHDLPASRIGKALSSSSYVISSGHIEVAFLPNYLSEGKKRLQLYRNFGGEDYKSLAYRVLQNGKVIKHWIPLYSLNESTKYAILGHGEVSGRDVERPWERTFNAGSYNLAINDSLDIIVQNVNTKKVVKSITIVRAVDSPTDFIYYQMPLMDGNLSKTLQNVLNTGSGIPAFSSGKTTKIFEKDYGSIGILRFRELDKNEEIQYSFGDRPYNWQPIKSTDPSRGLFLVLSNEMDEGTYQHIYLRYNTQPESINRITIMVKHRPFQMPWLEIATVSMLLLVAGVIWYYLRSRRNRRRVDALKRKNEDTEMRLSLLNGQLNPHFLFNSLNAIQGTIGDGNLEKTNAYIGSVARFMRDVMDNGRKEFVSLEEELKIEEDYLKLEQKRTFFSYDIKVAADLRPELIDFPPLLLQPILENSIRHAFGSNTTDPTITINIYSLKGALIVEIGDNGTGKWDIDCAREGHGLSLTRKRITVYTEKLGEMSILMDIKYVPGRGTITIFTFQNWLE
ncbi:MAG: hypothetical protein EOO85_11015 [Pedobacter sp.]|nr:MAG: hypothetical protein EOO85_11015 [Pedobacter sp.]